MSQGTKIKVHITGGPPWGFRLQGGGNTPVSIAKIRRKSKAYNARLQEGDEIAAVNGRNVRNMSRDVTMSYVDGAKESLDLEVIRRDKNFNTVNASTSYSIANNKPTITTGKPATIQLIPSSGSFQAPGRPASTGSVRQTTNIQTQSVPGERAQTQQTITRTVTQRVGDGDEKTSTTREVKTFGGTPAQETTSTVINTGGQPRTKSAIFQPTNVVSNAKPTGWSPNRQPQQQHHPEPIRVGQTSTIHLQGSFDEPAQEQQPRDLAQLIPSQSTQTPSNVQFNMRPSLAKPQSVSPTWHPPTTSSAPPTHEDTSKRWSAPAKANVGKEMTITFSGPGKPMNIPIGVAAPIAVVAPAPPQLPPPQQTTVTKYSTRTVTTFEKTSVDEESSDEEPQAFVRTATTIETNTSNLSEPVSILEDPSIILRGGFKPKDPKKVKMMRPKSFPGASAAADEPDLPETDKMKACKTIADLLMFPKNKSAKGAKMFAKRRKRSAKWTLEAYGTRGEDEELPEQIGPRAQANPSTPTKIDRIVRLPGVAPPAPPPPPPPPPPPLSAPVYIPHLGIHIAPTDFSINTKKKDKCEHKTISPQQCGMLVADLKGSSGRGASMFERRRERSEKFVLTNDGKKLDDSPEGKENEPPKEVTLEFIAMHGQEEKEPVLKPVAPTPPVNLQRKTPWQAAMDSPVGSIDSAFNHVSKKSFTGVNLPPKAERPKPPAEWMATTNILPQIPAKPPVEPKIKPKFRASGPTTPDENGHSPPQPLFKPKFDARKQAAENTSKMNYTDFNKRARGWSHSPQYSPENTPPLASPGSVHSADFAGGSPGFAASLPTQPLKYGGGYNDFNKKPRSFGSGGGGSPNPPWVTSQRHDAMESDEL